MVAASTVAEDIVARPTVEYDPSVWGDYFINLPPSFDAETKSLMQQRLEKLKAEISRMLQDEKDLLIKMRVVDAIQRLGIAYHFEDEISEALDRIYEAQMESGDLYAIALRFRLLRQEGYNMSAGAFHVFKDDDGNFKETLSGDVEGLLSLYEAAYLGTHGETILDEAIKFCGDHLKAKLDDVTPEVAVQISHSLRIPLHRRTKRLEARHYISIYETMEGRNISLLEFAKLDFNLLQSLHQEEIRNLSVWWKELGLATKLKFARDKLVECYFWNLGVRFEPSFSRTRVVMTKMLIFVSFLDDIYDGYGTMEELEVFNAVLLRWDLEFQDQLPECLKIFLIALVKTFEGFENGLVEGHSHQVDFLKKGMNALAMAYFEEAKWRSEKCVPTFEVHLGVSSLSAAYQAITCASWFGVDEVATKEAFEWLFTFPKILRASSVIGRLMNDIVSYEREKKREHVASSIQCYMKEYGTTLEHACLKLQEKLEDAWKDINEESLKPTAMSMPLLMPIINLARIGVTFYIETDAYTYSSKATKDHIILSIIQPIVI